MALEGSLRDFDLFSLFHMIQMQGKHGTLRLTRGAERVQVAFEGGLIVGCGGSQLAPEDRLGTLLVRRGRLSAPELEQLMARQAETLTRLGDLLLERGKVTPRDLQEALEAQALAVLRGAFRWTEGSYRFDSELPQGAPGDLLAPLSVDTVLMDAARVRDEWPQVERRLPPRDRPLARAAATWDRRLDLERGMTEVLTAGPASPEPASGLSHAQEAVLALFSGPLTLEAALRVSPQDDLETCKAVADLLELGWLEAAEVGPGAPAPPVGREAPSGRPESSGLVLWSLVALGLLWALWRPLVGPSQGLSLGLACFRPGPVVEGEDGPARRAWVLSLARDEVGATMGAGDAGGPRSGSRP